MNSFQALLRAVGIEGTVTAGKATLGCVAGSCGAEGADCPVRFHGVKPNSLHKRAVWATYGIITDGKVTCAACAAPVELKVGSGELAHFAPRSANGSACALNLFPVCDVATVGAASGGAGSKCNLQVELRGPRDGYVVPLTFTGKGIAASYLDGIGY